MSASRRRTLASWISAGWTGLEDGAAGELERAEASRASGIGHLRVVADGVDEPGGAEVHSECHSVTGTANTRVERVRRTLESALGNWREHGSAIDLRRRLHRLLIELDHVAE
jgi:hypothetical protein